MDKHKIVPVYQRMLKRDYLEGVKNRLENDVKVYIEAVEQEATQGRFVGFFGIIRLLMPTIEAIATTIYRGERKTQRLLEKLGFDYPDLVWQSFRHSLMHNDHLGEIQYRGQRITWGTSITGMSHIMQHGQIHIDSKKLYEDLIGFLNTEIAATGSTHVYVKIGVKYRSKVSKRIKAQAKTILT
jgi:hypothetical protein